MKPADIGPTGMNISTRASVNWTKWFRQVHRWLAVVFTVLAYGAATFIHTSGFAAVYLAQPLSLDRQVALKVVLPSGQQLPAREGQSLAQVITAEGEIELFGRDSVTINSGGEKIFAEEVEQALAHHPDVGRAVRASARRGDVVRRARGRFKLR